MLENKIYTLSELKEAIIKESNDTKPIIGKGVIKDDAKNNVKAVKDIMKQTKDYNDVPSSKRNTSPEIGKDLNKTTMDMSFTYEPDKAYKERVMAQVKGFPSADNEKNTSAKDNDSLDFEGNKDFYDGIKKRSKETNDFRSIYKHAGLKTHNLPKETTKIKTAFQENKTMKRLVFKNTVFFNEENVKKRIPEDYKTDNNKFLMKDSIGNEYIVECKKDKEINYINTNIRLIKASPKIVNEELSRIKALSSYSTSKYLGESVRTPEQDFIKGIDIVKNKLNEITK